MSSEHALTTPQDVAAQRQRLAWSIMLAGFVAFAALVVSVPIVANIVVQRARVPLYVQAQANEGTLGMEVEDNGFAAVRAGDAPLEVPQGATLTTTPRDTGLLLLYAAEGVASTDTLAQVQMYGSTAVDVREASTPRFSLSSLAHRLRFSVPSGRVRLLVPDNPTERFIDLAVSTPHGTILVEATGEYSIDVANDETQVTVQEGRVLVLRGDNQLILNDAERAVVNADGTLVGPLASERNLIKNGDFEQELDGWTVLAWNIEREDQPEGTVKVDGGDGAPLLELARIGVGAADGRLLQVIDQDVTDFASLRLLVTMRIVDQSLSVCGIRGSECPLMVQIDYVDSTGAERTWQQGFYAIGTPGPDTPDVCQFCPPPINEHEEVAFGQVVFRESPNLLEEMRQQGIEIRRIESIWLIAAGHTFDVEVLNVALIGKE